MRKLALAISQAFIFSLLLFSLFGSVLLVPLVQHIDSSNIQHDVLVYDWVYMSYVDADNNLDSYGVDDVNEMEQGYIDAVSGHVKVITLIDRYYGSAATYDIEHDTSSSINSPTLTTGFPSEPNMGQKSTLKNFITYVFNNYESNHYLLDLWDHGGGIFGICWDDSSSDDRLSFDEVDEAISEACSAAGKTIDILAMDACLMQMIETCYEFRDYVSYIVASEETIPGDGYPYNQIIGSICNNYGWTALQYATDMVNDYHNSYSSSQDTTLSVVDVGADFNTLMTAFDTFCTELQTAPRDALIAARAASQQFYYEFFIDLKDFANEVASRTSGSVSTAATTLSDLIAGGSPHVVENSQQHNNPQAYGLAIYFPETEEDYDSGYETIIDFGAETEWVDVLDYIWNGPTYSLAMSGYSIVETVGNPTDGNIDQGETITMPITITNTGSDTGYTVNGTLECTDGNITLTTAFQSYSTISAGSPVSRNFQFTVDSNAPTGLVIELTFTINATFITTGYINYYRVQKLYIIINITTVIGGSDFDSAVSIDGELENDIALFYSILPGPDVTDSSSWFKITMSDTTKYLIAGIIYAPPATDFDVYLYTPNGVLISQAVTNTYPDICSTFLPITGQYRIRVVPYNGTGVYQMNVTISPVPGPEDGLSYGTAYSFSRNVTSLTSSIPHLGKNYVFFRVYLYKNEVLKATLDGVSGTHDFDLYLVDYNGEVLTYTYSANYPESLKYSAKYEGHYYLVVVPYSGSGSFKLTVEYQEPFKLEGWLMWVIIIIVVLVVIVGIWLFFKMTR